ncbi:MAG: cation diffusion facilitator family transporter [Alphaproteobacteria bacterium]|nr:cation diffusion facilitator family transporter [Alphaproteobacteria bacterium]
MPQTLSNEQQNKLKKIAVTASIILACILCIIKTFASVYTGSLAILSSLIDSLSDVFASSVSYIAVKFSTKPANCSHRYGYGRAESLSALVQSAFVAGSGLFVLYDGFNRIFNPLEIHQTTFGLIIMLISLVATIVLISFQKYVSKLTGSVAISADSAHYVVDVLTNISIILSLVVVKFLKFNWFDIFTAALIAIYLIYNAYKIAAEAIGALTDKELSDEIRNDVIEIINSCEGIKGFHDFRSRDLGGIYLFEIHLELDGNLPLFKAHELTENVENKIQSKFYNAQIIIHQDPFGINEARLDDVLDGKCNI